MISAAENARNLQRAVDNPDSFIRSIFDGGNKDLSINTHMNELGEKFDHVIDWEFLQKATKNPELQTLYNPDLPAKAHLPFNPRNSLDYPKVSKLARETTEAGLKAAEKALRAEFPPPPPPTPPVGKAAP